MRIPSRIAAETGKYSLVDGIPFQLPVESHHSPALMAAFSADAGKIAALLPGSELHPLRLPGGKGVVLITVIDYLSTNIGRYIEFSVGFGVTHGVSPAPPLLPLLLQSHYDMGQYVFDLPVSTEISVKGGKGIWGMPKHQANLDFRMDSHSVSSQYDLDGKLGIRVTIRRPRFTGIPLKTSTVNFCAFRGMLMKSYLFFHGDIGVGAGPWGGGELIIGDSPRVAPLHDLDISKKPMFTVFFPSSAGVLDDHAESWFLGYEEPPTTPPEGIPSVVDLNLSQEWLPPPSCAGRLIDPAPEVS